MLRLQEHTQGPHVDLGCFPELTGLQEVPALLRRHGREGSCTMQQQADLTKELGGLRHLLCKENLCCSCICLLIPKKR